MFFVGQWLSQSVMVTHQLHPQNLHQFEEINNWLFEKAIKSLYTHPTNTSTFQLWVFLLYVPFSKKTTAEDLLYMAGTSFFKQSPLHIVKYSWTGPIPICLSKFVDWCCYNCCCCKKMIKSLRCWTSNSNLSYINCSSLLTPAINKVISRTDATNQPSSDAKQPAPYWPTTSQEYLLQYVTSSFTPCLFTVAMNFNYLVVLHSMQLLH